MEEWEGVGGGGGEKERRGWGNSTPFRGVVVATYSNTSLTCPLTRVSQITIE